MGKDELAIQGSWARGNTHYWAEWNFAAGSYSYFYDDGFTNITEKDRCSIVETGDGYIDLELSNRSSIIGKQLDERVEMRIKFQEDGSISIKGGDYYPVGESTMKALVTAVATAGK